MHNQKYKTLLNNTFLLGLGTFGSKLLTFLMVRFYTGVLSPSDYGTADLIMQTANLLIPIASLGITNGVFRFALDRVSQRKTVFTGGLITIVLGSAVLLHRFQLFVYASCQMRIHRCNRFTCTAFRSDSRDFCLRMSVQQTQQLNSGIACRTNNTCFHIHPPLNI